MVGGDEALVPADHPDSNEGMTRRALLDFVSPRAIHPMYRPMPIDDAADAYDELVRAAPPIDVVHLGLGPDGHTASLVPGDPVLEVTDRDVALTGEYQGRRRMTLTYPVLDRARRVLWLVTGADKVDALARLRAGDESIPGGRVATAHALVVADAAAAGSGS